MRYFFDTEFIDDGRTIELLSLGMVGENGSELYLEHRDADLTRASPWVRAHVLPHLNLAARGVTKRELRDRVIDFVGADLAPEFWVYFGAYDWVALMQLFGTMMDKPAEWPYYALDLRQLQEHEGVRIEQPEDGRAHNALYDARWICDTWHQITRTISVKTSTGVCPVCLGTGWELLGWRCRCPAVVEGG